MMLPDIEYYDEKVVIDKLREHADTFPTRTEAGKALGVGRVFLWRVLEGQARPTKTMLEHIGFTVEREINYRYRKL